MTSVDKFIIAASRLNLTDIQIEDIRVLVSAITDWNLVYKTSVLHRVAPFIYYTLKQYNLLPVVPSDIANKLHSQYLRSFLYNKSLFNEIDHLSNDLREFKIILLKGSALNISIYPDMGIRPMSDVDVLIYKKDRFNAFNALRGVGWIPCGNELEKSDIHRKVSDVDHKHLPKLQRTNNSGYVELHWKFFAGEDDDVLAKEGMDTAIAYKDNLFLLNKEMMLSHLCSNFTDGYDMGETLRTLCDIHEFLLNEKIDWNEMDRICAHEPLHSKLLTALNCLKWLFGYEIPSKYITDEFNGVEPSLDFLAADKIPDRTIGKIRMIRETYKKSGGLIPFIKFVYKNCVPDEEWLNARMPKESKHKLLAYWKVLLHL